MPKDKFKTILGYGVIVLISVAAFWYGNLQREARIARDATPTPSQGVKVVVVTPTPTQKPTSTPKPTSAPKATSTPKPTAAATPSPTPTQAPQVAGVSTSNNIPTTGPLDSPFIGFLAMIGAAEVYRRSRKNSRSLRTR